MGEHEPRPSEPEEPVIFIETQGREFELRPHNTEVVRHIGRYALYDFIYHEFGDNSSMYIFREVDIFEDLAAFLMNSGYPTHLNIQEVLEDDKQAYENMVIEEMWNGLPKDLLGEEDS